MLQTVFIILAIGGAFLASSITQSAMNSNQAGTYQESCAAYLLELSKEATWKKPSATLKSFLSQGMNGEISKVISPVVGRGMNRDTIVTWGYPYSLSNWDYPFRQLAVIPLSVQNRQNEALAFDPIATESGIDELMELPSDELRAMHTRAGEWGRFIYPQEVIRYDTHTQRLFSDLLFPSSPCGKASDNTSMKVRLRARSTSLEYLERLQTAIEFVVDLKSLEERMAQIDVSKSSCDIQEDYLDATGDLQFLVNRSYDTFNSRWASSTTVNLDYIRVKLGKERDKYEGLWLQAKRKCDSGIFDSAKRPDSDTNMDGNPSEVISEPMPSHEGTMSSEREKKDGSLVLFEAKNIWLSIPSPREPRSPVFHPDNKFYFMDQNDLYVLTLDAMENCGDIDGCDADYAQKVREDVGGSFALNPVQPELMAFATYDSGKIINLSTMEMVFESDDSWTSVAFDPGGKWLAVGLDKHLENSLIKIYETSTMSVLKEIESDSVASINQLMFSPDGRFLAWRHGTTKINISETASWTLVIGLDLTYKDRFLNWEAGFSFSPCTSSSVVKGCSTLFAAGIYEDLTLWETESWQSHLELLNYKAPGTINHNAFYPMTFSPDGAYVVMPTLDGDGIAFLDVQSGIERLRLDLPNDADDLDIFTSLAFSPDGRYLFLGADGTIIVWEFET